MGITLTPILTSTAGTSKAYNPGMAETYSWLPIEGEALGRPLYAQASFITNFSDLQIQLSASEVDIGSVHISDHSSGITADVVADGGTNGLRVVASGSVSVSNPITAVKVSTNGNTLAVSGTTVVSNTVSISTTQTLPISGTVTVSNLDTTVGLLTAIVATASNQIITNTLLSDLTANNSTADNQVITNSLLNSLTANNATATNQVTTNNLLNALTANNATATNQVTTNTLLNTVTANQSTQIALENTLSANSVYGTLSTQPLFTSVTNPVTSVTVTNPVTSVNAVVTNTVGVSAINLPVTVTNTIETVTTTNPVQLDAFGRFRVSTPLTLFDSSHRYKDNNLWSSLTAVNGTTYAFNQNQGLMDLTVTAASGSSVIRETTKVFTYQPGKSLLVLNTFVFAPSATNLRQRTGYFGANNGIYFQMDDATISFVERSLVTGSPSETTVPMSAWNIDKMDGTGPSGFTLDITKAQISWMDIEWLGVGTVRCGFVIDGKFVHCHSFHHANKIASTYITTASLPLRYEITNKAATNGSRTMKQICSSVISEGGYELGGLQQAVQTPITAPVDLPAPAGTVHPVISIRLKSNRLDAIVILTALSLMGIGNGPEYNWQVRASATTSGGTWISAGDDSAVEYKIDGGTVSGGRILASGFFSATNQSTTSVDILKEALFKFQLERNGLTGDRYELTLVCATNSAGADVFASMDWEEVSR